MPIFEYKGTDTNGKKITGLIQEENIKKAKIQLKKDNIFIFDIKNKKNKKKDQMQFFVKKTVDIKTLCTMTRLLSTLIKSNVPLVDSLTTITQQIVHPVLTPALTQIRNQINEGQEFHTSLKQYPKIFNTSYISMCEAGESSGTLDIILLKLAEFTENQAKLSSKIHSALAYPTLITVFTCGVILFLFTYIIPKVTELFEEENVMPWHTTMLINTSQNIINFWPQIMISFVTVYIIIYRWIKTKNGKQKIDTLLLKTPLIGKIIRSTAIARFSRTLATLLKGGVPMLKAMDIVQNVTNNTVLKNAIQQAKLNIREGESIARPLQISGQFPPMTIQMIKIGEKTGDLENMLVKISDTYDFQINSEIDTLTSLLGPAMIMIMGGVVSFIVFSVLAPIMQMYNQI